MPADADTLVERQRKLAFAVMLACMGFAGMMTGKMTGDAFALHCVGLMGFFTSAVVVEKYIKGRDARLTNAETNA